MPPKSPPTSVDPNSNIVGHTEKNIIIIITNFLNVLSSKLFKNMFMYGASKNNTTYNVSNTEIENYIKNIMKNPKDYLLSLNPYYKDDKPLLANKKSLN